MRARAFLALGVLPVLLATHFGQAFGEEAELPQTFLDTTYVPPTGQTIAVTAGGDFQAALNEAHPGDVITLEAGATFTGPFVLPNKAGDRWIIIRTSAVEGRLPPPGRRVNPSYADAMPKIVVPPGRGAAITTVPGAHHFRFLGIEVHPVPGSFVFNLIQLGGEETDDATLPHDIIVDRCYLHGDPVQGTRRGIILNSKATAVIDSYFSDFKEVGSESQAMMGWNGSGPFKIVNNYLEAAGENVMFGGADPTIPNLVPSDIEIRHNHFFKPLSWRIGDPSYIGTPWMVKNLFELKNAQRVLIDGNIFEHNWPQAQNGFAILFTVRNQDGTAPWSVVQDVTFTRNIVRHTTSGLNILGLDDTFPSRQTMRVLIEDDLFVDVGGPAWGGGGILFQLLSGTANVTVDHNTAFQTDKIILAEGAPHVGFVYINNIAPHNEYGVFGSDIGTGINALNAFFPGYVFVKNVLAGGNPALYPADNFFPASLDDVGFVDLAGGDYSLAPSSPYRHAGTDGKDLGADFKAIRRATAGVLTGFSGGLPTCGAAQASRSLLWPPNHELVPVGIVGVTDPGNDPVTITITGVTQDEPVNGLGDGDLSPDAVISGSGVWVRAERSGTGNGRVYEVQFTADDGQGGTCTGSVMVGVPRSTKPHLPFDDGQLHTSVQP